jgi:hypothetical protein
MEKTLSIEGGNKLICEFMEIKIVEADNGDPVVNAGKDRWLHVRDWARYHKSWGWLMPVVEKINNHHYPEYYLVSKRTEDDGPYDDTGYLRTFGMRDNEGRYMVRFNASALHYGKSLIEATWIAVVDWIQWYNNPVVDNSLPSQLNKH